jgi:hypothetical protein
MIGTRTIERFRSGLEHIWNHLIFEGSIARRLVAQECCRKMVTRFDGLAVTDRVRKYAIQIRRAPQNRGVPLTLAVQC